MHIDFSSILQDVISGLTIAGITACISYLFLNKYIEKINFSNKMKSYGFWETSTNKQSKNEIKKMCDEAVKIKMIYVSGYHYLNINEQVLKEALKKGTEIYFLSAHPDNVFLDNIENMERNTIINGKKLREDDAYISDEIWGLVDKYKDSGLKIRFYSTEYRLPYILAYYKDGSVDAWLTVTLPPYKSTKSFVLRGKRTPNDLKNDAELNFIDMMESNFDTIWNYNSFDVSEFERKNINNKGQ